MSIFSGKDPNWVAKRGTVVNGLVGHWDSMAMSAADRAGNRWLDLSGNGNHGTLTNGAAFDTIGCNFDGSNDYVESQFVNGNGPFFVSCWWKRTANAASGNKGIVSRWIGEGSNNRSWVVFYELTSNNYGFIVSDNGSFNAAGQIISSTASRLNQWDHVGCLFVPSALQQIWVNGVLVSSSTSSILSSVFSGVAPLRIGTQFFDPVRADTSAQGQIDDVRCYNRALSATEISTNFNALRKRFGV